MENILGFTFAIFLFAKVSPIKFYFFCIKTKNVHKIKHFQMIFCIFFALLKIYRTTSWATVARVLWENSSTITPSCNTLTWSTTVLDVKGQLPLRMRLGRIRRWKFWIWDWTGMFWLVWFELYSLVFRRVYRHGNNVRIAR